MSQPLPKCGTKTGGSGQPAPVAAGLPVMIGIDDQALDSRLKCHFVEVARGRLMRRRYYGLVTDASDATDRGEFRSS
jgi:hypothetical protein